MSKEKPTLAEKQVFWTEQLPLFKEAYWLPEHFELLKFDMEAGNFVVRDDIDPDFKGDADDLYHRINTGWSMWKRAINHMQKKLEGCVVVPKNQIETWWQDAEEPENFATTIESIPAIGESLGDKEIMEIEEHHTIHLPSNRVYGTWVEQDGERSFVVGSLEECRAVVEAKADAEG
ncbi:hypothetical protein [Acinetobacter gyllenbergii]|uniref:hypothetical protein n=1 Tax=Acinetobacter gyllenbergii TaxID=134534 RepID=UPI000806EC37|nr:hypothetical protein [Acinetobacter gyllenbergii]